MKQKIEEYIKNLTIYDVNDFALKNNIFLSRQELEFIFRYIKDNHSDILRKDFNLEKLKTKFDQTNFVKINDLLKMYQRKYSMFL